jgi:hypothetical protein
VHTYWNGQPAPARRVRVVVGPRHGGDGDERAAVEVRAGGVTFYLDDADGSAWAKVTTGLGSPRLGHRGLPDARLVVAVDVAPTVPAQARSHRQGPRRRCRSWR